MLLTKFCLMGQHQFRDYPDFFQKLYKLFDRNLMHVKYRARFFSQVDIFLSSPYVHNRLLKGCFNAGSLHCYESTSACLFSCSLNLCFASTIASCQLNWLRHSLSVWHAWDCPVHRPPLLLSSHSFITC